MAAPCGSGSGLVVSSSSLGLMQMHPSSLRPSVARPALLARAVSSRAEKTVVCVCVWGVGIVPLFSPPPLNG